MNQLVNVKILSALVLAATIVTAPTGAAGFFQSTVVEGEIGADVGGVWLGMYFTAPTFRMRANLSEDKAETFEVGAVPDEFKPLIGTGGSGVSLTAPPDPDLTRGASLFEGDIITAVDSEPVGDVDDFKKRLAAADKGWVLIQVLRPALRQSMANIVKIQYSATVEEVDGTSMISAELVRVTLLDDALPFADKLEKGRQERDFYTPTDAEIEALRDQWYRLGRPEHAVFVGGEHRMVGVDDYDLNLRKDHALRDTQFALISTLKGNPATGGGSTIAIYGFRDVGAEEMRGSYIQSSLAAAPFPISIDFVGAFRMVKLGPFSLKDAEHRNAVAEKSAGVEEEEDWDAIELEPDVPADP